jgi:O-antigen/teichoic acid export membrane protein
MSQDILKGVARNTGIMLVQQIITWTSTFILMMFLPRYLGPVEYGTVFLGMSIGAIFGIIVSYGGNLLVAKAVSRDPGRTAQIIVDASAFRVVLWFFVFCGAILFCQITGYRWHEQVVIYIFVFALSWQGPEIVLYSAFQGRELMTYTSRAWIAEKVFVSIVGIIALLMGGKAIEISIIMVIGSFLNFLILLFYLRVIAPVLSRIQWHGSWEQMKEGVPYFMFTAFSTIYYRINSVVLSKTVPDQVLGWFGGAMRFFEMMNFFPFIFTIAIYPVFSRLWKSEEEKYHQASQKSLEFILMFGLPFSLIIAMSADGVISFFYGIEQYGPSIPVLQLLAGGAVFLFLNMILGTVLLSSDRQRQQSIITLVAIPVSIILNITLIPLTQSLYKNGGIGAALSTVLVEMFVMLAMWRIVPKEIFKGFRLLRVGKVLSATAVTGVCLYIFRYIGVHWIISAVIAATAYVPLLRLFRGIGDDDWRLVRDVIVNPQLRKISERLHGRKDNPPNL